jgi:hypothetical protein
MFLQRRFAGGDDHDGSDADDGQLGADGQLADDGQLGADLGDAGLGNAPVG